MADKAEPREAYRIALRKDVWLEQAASYLDDALHALEVADDPVASETREHIRTASWVVRQRHTQARKERMEALKALQAWTEAENAERWKEIGHG